MDAIESGLYAKAHVAMSEAGFVGTIADFVLGDEELGAELFLVKLGKESAHILTRAVEEEIIGWANDFEKNSRKGPGLNPGLRRSFSELFSIRTHGGVSLRQLLSVRNHPFSIVLKPEAFEWLMHLHEIHTMKWGEFDEAFIVSPNKDARDFLSGLSPVERGYLLNPQRYTSKARRERKKMKALLKAQPIRRVIQW